MCNKPAKISTLSNEIIENLFTLQSLIMMAHVSSGSSRHVVIHASSANALDRQFMKVPWLCWFCRIYSYTTKPT